MSAGFRGIAEKTFAKFKGQPAKYLEIGIYEGISGCFMLDNILTHPDAEYIGIDPYESEHKHALLTATMNLEKHNDKCWMIVDFSYNVLPRLLATGGAEQFEMIYIDGCHSYAGCKLDLEQSWPLLKRGGIILCDDYERDDYGVKQAVDEFLYNRQDCELLRRDYSICWEKL